MVESQLFNFTHVPSMGKMQCCTSEATDDFLELDAEPHSESSIGGYSCSLGGITHSGVWSSCVGSRSFGLDSFSGREFIISSQCRVASSNRCVSVIDGSMVESGANKFYETILEND